MEWITANLPIILSLVVGIGLLVVEAFIPGFGVAGFSGAILEVAAVVLTWLSYGVGPALLVLLVALAVAAVTLSMSLRSIARGKLSETMILHAKEDSASGYQASDDTQVFLGREGVATTVLRPTGMGEFDGVKLNVMTDGEFLPEGTKIRITRTEGSRIQVQRV